MASYDRATDDWSVQRGGGSQDRFSRFTAGQRPQRKPRPPDVPTRTSSLQQNEQKESVQEATSASADSSTQLSKDKKSHRILQPTPLVLALRNQLISKVTEKDQPCPRALADSQQQDTDEERLANEDKVSLNVKKNVHDWDLPGDNLMMSSRVKRKSSPLHSRASQEIQRQHGVSELMVRPPKPARSRSPPNPISRLQTDENLASQHIGSRTKALSTRHPDPGKTTYKSRTPPPRYPPPVLPHKKATPIEQTAPVPKPRKPHPKPRNAASSTAKGAVDEGYEVYEDLDKDEVPYKMEVNFSRKDILPQPTTYKRDKRNFTREIPPALPPKNGSKGVKEDEQLPPLPPRIISSKRHHDPAANHRGYGRLKDCVVGGRKEQEPVQDAEVYEPIGFDEDSDTDESHRFYTEMSDPPHQTWDDSLENDQPGELYIAMDPEEYIPPPRGYKHNQSFNY